MTTAAAPRPHSHHAEKLALKDRAAPGRLAPVAARHGVEMPAVVFVYPEPDPGAVLAALAPILGAGGGSIRAHRETIGVSDRTSRGRAVFGMDEARMRDHLDHQRQVTLSLRWRTLQEPPPAFS